MANSADNASMAGYDAGPSPRTPEGTPKRKDTWRDTSKSRSVSPRTTSRDAVLRIEDVPMGSAEGADGIGGGSSDVVHRVSAQANLRDLNPNGGLEPRAGVAAEGMRESGRALWASCGLSA